MSPQDDRKGRPRNGGNTHQPELPNRVTLSAAKGLSRWAARCFATLSMTGRCLPATRCQGERVPPVVPRAAFSKCHPKRSEGLSRWAARCFATLSMTGRCLPAVLLPPIVTLSEATSLSAAPDCHPERSEGSGSMGRDASLRSA